jgi:hypothetical protein
MKTAKLLTENEVQALRAAYRSAYQNGHDFGFVEDIVRDLKPMKAQAVGALVTSLVQKKLIEVHPPVTTDSGTYHQFCWKVSTDYVGYLCC